MRLPVLALAIVACTTRDSRDGQELARPFPQQCPAQTVEGVDVFAGTGTIDWTKVAQSGRAFAFVKATQGNYNKQSTFAANWTGTKAAGVVRSAYHFFDPTIDGAAQATWFLDELAAAGGMQAGDLPAMLDIECPTSSSQSAASPNCEYAGNSGWAPSATIVQRVFDWLAAVEQATGRAPIVYSYPSWFGDVAVTDARLASYPLFIATYAACADVPAPWTAATFWQYSDTGSVPGIAGAVDEDRFVGSAGDLATFVAVPPDAGVAPDAGTPPAQHAGCGCEGSGGGIDLGLVLVIALLVANKWIPNSRSATDGLMASLVCATCRKLIPLGSPAIRCTVASCNTGRLKLRFCSVTCWEKHVPTARHRKAAYNVERQSTPEPPTTS